MFSLEDFAVLRRESGKWAIHIQCVQIVTIQMKYVPSVEWKGVEFAFVEFYVELMLSLSDFRRFRKYAVLRI